jgi:Flp pilus assembly protein TadG
MRIKSFGLGSRKARRAVAAAELVVISPLLATLVLGAVDFGRFAYYYIAVTNAARAGASYAIMNNYTSSTLTTWKNNVSLAAKDEMTQQVGSGNIGNLTVTVPTPTQDANGLRRVQVTASWSFTTIVNWQWTGLGLPHTMNLQRKVEMRLVR